MEYNIGSLVGWLRDWANANEGFVDLLLFLATLFLGWVSGFFRSLIQRPRLRAIFHRKATFYSCFTDVSVDGEERAKLAFAVQMSVSNVGNVPTSIRAVELGYYAKRKFFVKTRVWLRENHIGGEFVVPVDGDDGIYIRKFRINEFQMKMDDYLMVGGTAHGVVYFEPRYIPFVKMENQERVRVWIRVTDVYDRKYVFSTMVPPINIDKARAINPYFANMPNLRL